MSMFSECCTQGEDDFPVDMFCCQVCGQSRCSGCQYGDRIDLTNITGFKGKGNVCKACLAKVKLGTETGGWNFDADHERGVKDGAAGLPKTEVSQHYEDGYEAGSVTGVSAKGLSKEKLKPAYSKTLAVMELGDSGLLELCTEMCNQGVMNAPEPVCCPTCQGDLYKSQGMVGERVMVCYIHGMVWEDHEDAIRRVI